MRTPRIAVITGLILSFGSFIPEAALAQNSVKPIGKVLTTQGSVTVEHVNAVVVQASLGSQPGQAKVGDPIYQGDIVATGADGKVGIAFADGTAFDLSSNARMAMTEFVYDPNSTSNTTLLSLSKGTFTFVAGKIAKTGDMKIDTPVATMAFEARRHTSKSWTTGLSNFPPSSKRAKSARRHDGRTFQTTVRSPHSTFVGGAEPNSGLVGFALENRLLRRTPSCLLRAKSGRFEIGCQFALNSIGPLDRWPRLQVPGRLAPTKDDSCGRPGCLGSPWSGYQGPASFVGSEPPRSHVPLGAYHLAR